MALSICLKKQYDEVAGKKDGQRAVTSVEEEIKEPTIDSNEGYTLDPDEDTDQVTSTTITNQDNQLLGAAVAE